MVHVRRCECCGDPAGLKDKYCTSCGSQSLQSWTEKAEGNRDLPRRFIVELPDQKDASGGQRPSSAFVKITEMVRTWLKRK